MNSKKFILSPIKTVLEEAVQATSAITDGIENQPICDYLMQSILLKMTGFQEQKFKCICWEMANLDYDYRYQLLKDGFQGECSSYKQKNNIINEMIDMIRCENHIFRISPDVIQLLIVDTQNDMLNTFNKSKIASMNEKQYKDYIQNPLIKSESILTDKQKKYQIFDDILKTEYESKLYRFRNRCAHNLLSYQQNLPKFEKLLDDETGNNFFTWFSLLIIIDKILIYLFNAIVELKEELV